uniref:BAG domain-containing protein n=1 Tax=Oryza brachyantha TaxID=4533 RepID=J3MZC5_ORYBR
MAGVKDRSKMVLLEDPAAQAKRLLEQRRTDKAERAAKSISRIGLDVDKIAAKVTALEGIVAKGGKVVDADVVTLTEALMNELVKLDYIAADGEVKEQRRVQEKRVQKYVEALDAIAEGEVKVQRRMQEKRVQKYVESLDAIRAKNAAAHKANGNHRLSGAGAAHGELGVVRPAVVDAVHVVVHRDDHHGRRHHHLADPTVRLGALLASFPDRYTTLHYTLHLSCPFISGAHRSVAGLLHSLIISARHCFFDFFCSFFLFFFFMFLFLSSVYLQKKKKRNALQIECVQSVSQFSSS